MFNAFKEALKPCKATSSSSSLSSSSSSSSQQFESSITTRKPPKSSLSRQLLRIQEDSDLFSESHLRRTWDDGHNYDDGRGKVDDTEGNGSKNTKLEVFHGRKIDQSESSRGEGKSESGPLQNLHLIGPYEPLILSLPDEIPVVQVPASINSRLLSHQREGVKFLYNLYKNNHGGILGDDMGLGKTIQTIAFLAAVFGKDEESNLTPEKKNETRQKGPALIICPSSVITNWENEFSSWSTFRVSVYHGPNRDLVVEKLNSVSSVEVLITSFDTFRIQGSILSNIDWEIVVIDEAHKLKNEKSKLYSSCTKIKTQKRYGLTGTIMQNKIMEMFNLFDWAVPGRLGTREHFREFYDEPLKHGQRSSAPERFVRVADERREHLVSILSKYMLRRTKEETIGHLMMGKEDNVVFCAMSELQKRVYRRTLQLPDFQCLINKDLACGCGSPLKQVECCKRTVPNGLIWPYLHRENEEGCDSCPFCLVLPCLMKLQQMSNHLELIKPNPKDDEDKQKKDAEFASAVFGDDDRLLGGGAQNDSFMALSDVLHCGKMRALEKLMHSWVSRGDKILLFSYSVRMLNILEKFIIRKGYSFSRLDGSTPTGLRQSLVDDFNSSPSKQVFLISTRAGGLGLNLVSANRVVIFDPNWNPAQDLQAQDRSFRFGQKRHVTVFRLLAAGSLEELVYTRQVYKQQLSNIAVSGKMEQRYFEGVQDCKQFQGELFGISNLFRDLSNKAFTSEIIESRENRGKDDRGAKLDFTDLGITGFCSSDELRNDEDLGIVYAHRNEDIVNFGLKTSSKEKTCKITSDDQMMQPCDPAKDEGDPSVPGEAEGEEDDNFEVSKGEEDNFEVSTDSSKRRRNDNSSSDNRSLIALLLGMKEGELNKILQPQADDDIR